MASPIVSNYSPAPASTNVNPKTVISFDINDADKDLDYDSVQIRVNGVLAFHYGSTPSKFLNGYTGTYVDTTQGMQVALTPPDFLGDGVVVTVTMTGQDLLGNPLVAEPWSFTTSPVVSVSSVVASGIDVEVTFSQSVKVTPELFEPANYGLATRYGRAREAYVRSVTSTSMVPDALVTKVYLRLRDFFSLGGKYALSIQGIIDRWGRVVNIKSNVNT